MLGNAAAGWIMGAFETILAVPLVLPDGPDQADP